MKNGFLYYFMSWSYYFNVLNIKIKDVMQGVKLNAMVKVK